MACLNPDGTLTASAIALLKALTQAGTPQEAAERTGLPLYRIRSSLRELVEAGLLEESEGSYHTTPSGMQRIT
jgi:DNA-binding IclR family transcriptional regulator